MIQFAERTHPGRRSGANEDVTGVNLQRQWWFVADGMGGQGNGSVASSVVKQTMEARNTPDELANAIHHSHLQILAAATETPTLRNMGSTIVAIELKNRLATIAWVGDSRAYLYRNNQLKRATRDHSYVEVLRAMQGLTEEQVRGHPESNVITRGLGMEESAASLIELPLRKGDRFLLCSDGLTEELTDMEIARVLDDAQSISDAADKLMASALANGGKDNVSVVTVQYDGPSNRTYWIKNLKSNLSWPVIAAMLVVTLVAVFTLWWLSHRKH